MKEEDVVMALEILEGDLHQPAEESRHQQRAQHVAVEGLPTAASPGRLMLSPGVWAAYGCLQEFRITTVFVHAWYIFELLSFAVSTIQHQPWMI